MAQLVHRDELENPHPVAWRRFLITDHEAKEFAGKRASFYAVSREGDGSYVVYVGDKGVGCMKDSQKVLLLLRYRLWPHVRRASARLKRSLGKMMFSLVSL